MLKRSLCILIFSSLIFSNNYEFWLGAGSVGTVIPEFKGDFAVKDASASQSTYYFKADVSGADSHMPFNLGVKANLNDIIKVKGKLDVNLSTSMGFSPLGGGAYAVSYTHLRAHET